MVLQIHDDPLLSVSRSQLSSSDLGASDSVGLLSGCDYNPHSNHTLQVSEHCNTTAHSHIQPLISGASYPGFSVRYPFIIYLYLGIYYITGQREMERFCKGPMCHEALGGQVTGNIYYMRNKITFEHCCTFIFIFVRLQAKTGVR